MNKIGVGVIGASSEHVGWAAITHIPALQALPEYELRAVATSRRESAKAAAATYGVPAYHDGSDLIADPSVELVVVAVKVPEHAALISRALAAGKMVYSEWPLGVGSSEAAKLVDQADVAGVRTVIGLQGRYAPEVRHVRELVAEGRLGEILATTLVGSGGSWGPVTDRGHAYIYDLANGVTTLTATAMHALDAVAFALGEPARVAATMAVRQPDVRLAEDDSRVTVTAPDQVGVHAVLADGALLSSFHRGGMSRSENFRWTVTGTGGELLITSRTPANGNMQAIPLRLEGAFGTDTSMAELEIPDRDHPAIAEIPAGPARNVARLYAALAQDLSTGERTVPDFHYALKRHRLVDAIGAADHEGRVQAVL